MRRDSDDAAERFFRAARWYLPPMAGEPEPDPTLACTYALLAVYAKLDKVIDTMSAGSGNPQTIADATRDLDALARTLSWDPVHEFSKGPRHN